MLKGYTASGSQLWSDRVITVCCRVSMRQGIQNVAHPRGQTRECEWLRDQLHTGIKPPVVHDCISRVATGEQHLQVRPSPARFVGKLPPAGGRVLGVTALGADPAAARARAYGAIAQIHFDGMHFRRDIGLRGTKST